jgi:hypothetical protein
VAKYTLRFAQLGKRLQIGVNYIVQAVAIEVDQALVMATPVDTGRARSNWIASLGRPRRSVIGPYAPGKKLGLGESGNANAAMAQARAVITARTSNGQAVYITNNVPYIGDLNAGRSPQARPAGFAQRASQVGTATVRLKAPGLMRKALGGF